MSNYLKRDQLLVKGSGSQAVSAEAHGIFCVGVPDVEAALREAERLGGTRLMGPEHNAETGTI